MTDYDQPFLEEEDAEQEEEEQSKNAKTIIEDQNLNCNVGCNPEGLTSWHVFG